MLKLTLKPGEYIDIGDDIKVIFSGGSANNIHLLIDAPKDLKIISSIALKKRQKDLARNYYKEQGISPKAQKEIARILKEERTKQPG